MSALWRPLASGQPLGANVAHYSLECNEPRYAHSFSKKKGRRAKSVRVALGALIIKEKLNLTDEETLMVYFRKRLGPEIITEVNEIIAKKYVEKNRKKKKDPDDSDDDQKNDGQLILDATCIPQDIRFPNDVGPCLMMGEKSWKVVLIRCMHKVVWRKNRGPIRARKQYR